jgi:hypothetical protein
MYFARDEVDKAHKSKSKRYLNNFQVSISYSVDTTLSDSQQSNMNNSQVTKKPVDNKGSASKSNNNSSIPSQPPTRTASFDVTPQADMKQVMLLVLNTLEHNLLVVQHDTMQREYEASKGPKQDPAEEAPDLLPFVVVRGYL